MSGVAALRAAALWAVPWCALAAAPPATVSPAVPWADPIGVSPPLGTAPGAASVPWAQPIGASRLAPAPAADRRPRPARAARPCRRAVEAGRVVVRCAPSR